jgi:hypothetical protein
LQELRGQDLTKAEVEAEVRRFLAAGPAAIPVLLEQFFEEDEALLAVATQTLKAWGEPRPVEALLGLLRNPGVDALAKGLILIILEHYGLDVDRPEISGLAINLEEYPLDATGRGDGGNGGNGEGNEGSKG